MKELNLSRGFKALVDDADYEELNIYKWCYNSQGYAVRHVTVDGKWSGRSVSFHLYGM